MVGLVSAFLTIPDIVGNYLTKQQDIELAKEKTEGVRLGNLDSKQDQEFKIVHSTLAQQGSERVFILRYLAATLDDEAARSWAQGEVTRLDTLVTQQEELNKARRKLEEKQKELERRVHEGTTNNVKLEKELRVLKERLVTKDAEVAKLREKAGIRINPTNSIQQSPEQEDFQLTPSFSLSDLTSSELGERLAILNNPSGEVIRNLYVLSSNVLEPLREEFGEQLSIKSAYRSQELERALKNRPSGWVSRSLHTIGQAVDVEVEGVPNRKVACWVMNNLDFDRVMLENYDNSKGPFSGWVHVSFQVNRENRREILSYAMDPITKRYVYEQGIDCTDV